MISWHHTLKSLDSYTLKGLSGDFLGLSFWGNLNIFPFLEDFK